MQRRMLRNEACIIFLLIFYETRCLWAFIVPGLGAARQCALRDSPQERYEAAERALNEAARLRREIASMEEDFNKGKPTVIDDDDEILSLTSGGSGEYSESTSPFSLAPTRWLLKVNIGREKGTWMPPSWGRSGRRLEIDLCVQFLPGGKIMAKVSSPFVNMNVFPGRWAIRSTAGVSRRRKTPGNLSTVSDTCRFWVETEGFARGDVSIPPGKLYFAVPAWGGRLSRKGLVTVRQRRWFVREESRILGTFRTERIENGGNG